MRVPRWISALLGIMIVVALSRAILDSGPLSLYSVVEKLQGFDLGFDSIFETFGRLDELLLDGTVWWNDSLTGFSGFVINIKNVVLSFFTLLKNAFVVPFEILVDTAVSFFTFLKEFFGLITFIFGFDFGI